MPRNRVEWPCHTVKNCSGVTGFPPQLTLLKKLESKFTSVLIGNRFRWYFMPSNT